MSVRVVLLAPPPANPYTGGHLYNARVADRSVGVELRACAVDALPAMLAALATVEVPVLDSLFFAADLDAALLARCVWLVHLLPDADPNRTATERAALAPRIAAALAASAGAIATSEFTAAAIAARAPVAVRTCRPGVAVGLAQPDAGAPPRILSVANFEARKGLVELCHCLHAVADLAWHWDVVGDPTASPSVATALRDALAATGLTARTTLHGALAPDAVDVLRRRAALFALLSRQEPYGMVFAEAIAAGVPVIAWRSGGVPESVVHEVSGLLAACDDGAGTARNLRALLGNATRRATFGARARAQRFPSWAECAQHFALSARALARAEEDPS